MFKSRSGRDQQLACDMCNHVCCFERKLLWFHNYLLERIPHILVAFVARHIPQTAPNIHHSWRNRWTNLAVISVKHSVSYRVLVPGRWKSSRCNHLRTLNMLARKRNFNRSSATTFHVTSILVYIALLWRWRQCMTACIYARSCAVEWRIVRVTPTWPSLLSSLRSTCRQYGAWQHICTMHIAINFDALVKAKQFHPSR